jgi:excisionase family DNA binding protein
MSSGTTLTISIEGLETLIEQKVSEAVARELGRGEDPWFNSDDAAAYLGVARSTLHDLVADGKLPRAGARKTRLRFRKSTLDSYLDGHSIEGGKR